ncbi:MAG TPA: isoprenylcysteine carboxylmethyltransferase family protein [Candidatus Acidoferrales bacterium]|nr:isoprenylcysteine carboxylmethyltransferase family protein [Candidatus Acidoferrales bacterium]
MELLARLLLGACWIAWMFPFLFRAPHRQKRPSVTRKSATLAGLLMESAAIFLAGGVAWRPHHPPEWWRIAGILIFSVPSIALAWSAVKNLGKQFRVNAGLYEDHELVKTGAYSIIRHPIYGSLLGMLVATILVSTPLLWALASMALFIAGTEIRVRTEDRLLASRFGRDFDDYRRQVPAYIPFLR